MVGSTTSTAEEVVVWTAAWVVCSIGWMTGVVSTVAALSTDAVGRRAMAGAASEVEVDTTAEDVEDSTCSTTGACDVMTAVEEGITVGTAEDWDSTVMGEGDGVAVDSGMADVEGSR